MFKKSIFDIIFYNDFLKYKDELDINEINSEGDNALIVALLKDDYDTAHFLLKEGIEIISFIKYSTLSEVSDKNFETFLSSYEYFSRTREHPHIQKILIDKGISIKPEKKATDRNLCLTYHAANLEILKILIKNKNPIFSPDPHYKGSHEETALNNIPFNHDCWEYLIKVKKTPVNNFPSQSISPVVFSLRKIEDFKKIISLGGDLNIFNNLGNPLLFNANRENVEYLLDNVNDPYIKNSKNQNILFKAPADCIDIIMKKLPDIDINHFDQNDMTPLMCALDKQETKKVEKLLYHGADPKLFKNSENQNILFKASADCVDVIIKKYPDIDINHFDQNNMTPLMLALDKQDSKKVGTLLYHGADPNLFKNANHCFNFVNSGNCLEILLNKGVSFNFAFDESENALDFENMLKNKKRKSYYSDNIIDTILLLLNIEKEKRNIFSNIKNLNIKKENFKKRI